MTRINTKPLFLILRVFKLSEHLSAKVTTSGAPHTAAWGCDLVQKKQAWPTRPGGPNGGPAEAVTYVTEARGAGELWSTYRGAEVTAILFSITCGIVIWKTQVLSSSKR